MAATQPPTAGPPKKVEARIGANETACWVPRGICTGNAEETSVSTVQNAIPSRMVPGGAGPVPSWGGSAIASVRAKYKSRGNECNSTPCHDSNEKKLQGPRHFRPAVSDHRWNSNLS